MMMMMTTTTTTTATYSGSVTRKRIDTNYLTAGVSKKGAPLPP